nr:cytochrome P450 867K1 [Ginkgo biloba]
MLAIIVGTTVVMFIALIHRWKRSSKHKMPPGPRAWPIIGHLHLFRKGQPVHRTFLSIAKRYGNIISLRLGPHPFVIVFTPELARECFTTNDAVLASRPTIAATEIMAYKSTVLGLDPLTPMWRKVRKVCMSELLSTARIEMWKQIRVEEMSGMVRFVLESTQRGKTIPFRRMLLDASLNVLLRMTIGRRYFGVESKDAEEKNEFQDLIDNFIRLVGVFNVGDYFSWLKWMDIQGYEREMRKAHERMDAFLQRLLDEHRQRKGQVENPDFIDLLISNFDQDNDLIKATALSMIVAGSDTTSITSEWAMASVIKHPNVMKKAQEELDTHVGRDRVLHESDLPNLKYLYAVVKETLRLYPPAPLLVPRLSLEACKLGGYSLPAGTRVAVNAWAIHRDPALWERPLEFEPERFLSMSIDVRGQDYELLPFGSGRRSCPGAQLALRVVQLTLGRLLQGFHWSPPDENPVIDMNEKFGLSLVKAIQLEAVAKPRLPAHLY